MMFPQGSNVEQELDASSLQMYSILMTVYLTLPTLVLIKSPRLERGTYSTTLSGRFPASRLNELIKY